MDSFLDGLLASERLAQSGHDYLEFHKARFEYVVRLCIKLAPDTSAKVLDVGRSYLSWKLAQYYSHVVTLGFPLSNNGFGHEALPVETGSGPLSHVVFDLNDSSQKQIPTEERFDLIVFAEVIEHLYTSPELALHSLAELLTPGGRLICQTPNAVSLSHRVSMLRGRNPFERIRVNRGNPGHFREYTRAELIELGSIAGLRTVQHHYVNYFGTTGHTLKTVVRRFVSSLAPSLRSGQTIVYRRVV